MTEVIVNNPITQLEKDIPKYIITGFSIAAALNWNDLIKAFIEYIAPGPENKKGLLYKFIYTLLITLFVVLIIWLVNSTHRYYIQYKYDDKVVPTDIF